MKRAIAIFSLILSATLGFAQYQPSLVSKGKVYPPATTYAGNGAGITNLNATNLVGTLPLAQLPSGVVTNGLTNSLRMAGVGLTNGSIQASALSISNLVANNVAMFSSTGAVLFSSTTAPNGTPDAGLKRFSAGKMAATDGGGGYAEFIAAKYWAFNGGLVAAITTNLTTSTNFTSGLLAITTYTNLAHNLGGIPERVRWVLVCTDSGGDAGYAQNDEIGIENIYTSSYNPPGVGGANATTVWASFYTTSISTLNKTTSQPSSMTAAKWALKCYASRNRTLSVTGGIVTGVN